jgi:tetratricopeptide (TPR) repeat protein
LLLVSGDAAALSLGRLSGAPILNAPFTATVPITLGPGESLADDCVRAELFNGEDRIAPNNVRIDLSGSGEQRQLRIRSLQRLTEPLLTVYIEAGCAGRVSRRYTLFVDPVANGGPALADVDETSPLSSIVPQASTASRERTVGKGPDSTGSTESVAAPRAPRATAAPRDAARPASVAQARTAAAAPRAAAKPAAKPTRPRLTLDMAAPAAAFNLFQASPELSQTIEPPDEAKRRELRILRDALIAELEGKSDAGSFARRVDELQRSNQQLSVQLQAARAQAAQERAQREKLEAERFAPGIVYLLLGAVALLLAALGWMALRGRTARDTEEVFAGEPQSERAAAPGDSVERWYDRLLSSRKPAGEPPPQHDMLPERDAYADAVNDGFVDSIPVMRPGDRREAEALATVPNTASWHAALTPYEQVAVNEVADISQEAEFFMDIGEYDRAIALLEQNIDHEHHITPVPQLYLFDLYRKTGKREAYEKLRKEFLTHYNALIPQWVEEPSGGRELMDYNRAMELICREWRSPDIVATLESLLVDDTRGQRMGFELPAYRDIIFLHGIAKQLTMDNEQLGIDLGLPGAALALQPQGDAVDFELPIDAAHGDSPLSRRLTPPGSVELDIDFSELALDPEVKPPPAAPKPPRGSGDA